MRKSLPVRHSLDAKLDIQKSARCGSRFPIEKSPNSKHINNFHRFNIHLQRVLVNTLSGYMPYILNYIYVDILTWHSFLPL